jgi:hypothetical protein
MRVLRNEADQIVQWDETFDNYSAGAAWLSRMLVDVVGKGLLRSASLEFFHDYDSKVGGWCGHVRVTPINYERILPTTIGLAAAREHETEPK